MQPHQLRLEELAVESFSTSEDVGFTGTVKGYVDEDAEFGTFFSLCRSCPHTCAADFTCGGSSCPPQGTCDIDMTCAPDFTCNPGDLPQTG